MLGLLDLSIFLLLVQYGALILFICVEISATEILIGGAGEYVKPKAPMFTCPDAGNLCCLNCFMINMDGISHEIQLKSKVGVFLLK